MKIQSAGILVFRRSASSIEVLLTHPGGPFWAKKDVWSIPKGELEEDEDQLTGAHREFTEEVGVEAPDGELIDLGEAPQSNKINHIWAVEGDVDLNRFKSNSFEMEWPPKSGKVQKFPENDRAAWHNIAEARKKAYSYQIVFIDRLAEKLGVDLVEQTEPEQQSLL